MSRSMYQKLVETKLRAVGFTWQSAKKMALAEADRHFAQLRKVRK